MIVNGDPAVCDAAADTERCVAGPANAAGVPTAPTNPRTDAVVTRSALILRPIDKLLVGLPVSL
jgi:hypothetical protein